MLFRSKEHTNLFEVCLNLEPTKRPTFKDIREIIEKEIKTSHSDWIKGKEEVKERDKRKSKHKNESGKNYQSLVWSAEESLKTNDESESTLREAAEIYLKMGRYEKAIDLLKKCLDSADFKKEDDFISNALLIEAYLAMGNIKNAEKRLTNKDFQRRYKEKSYKF